MYHWGALPAAGAVQGRDGFEQIGPLNSLGKLIVPTARPTSSSIRCVFCSTSCAAMRRGPGKYRGGTGAAYRVLVEGEAEYAFRGEGQRTPSGYGVHGGGMGRPATSCSSAPTARHGFRHSSAPAASDRSRSG